MGPGRGARRAEETVVGIARTGAIGSDEVSKEVPAGTPGTPTRATDGAGPGGAHGSRIRYFFGENGVPRAAARGGVRDVRVSRIPTLVTGGMADDEGMGGADGAPSEGVTVGVAKGGWEGGNVRRRRVPGG